MSSRSYLAILSVLLSVALGCSRYEKPRSREDIFNDRIAVDTLYITKDGNEVIAPGTVRGVIVTKSGELAFEAWQCNNPNCPGRKVDGSPYLFPWPDPFAFVKEDGTPSMRAPENEAEDKLMAEFSNQRCPECLKQRKVATESVEEREKYRNWLQTHVLPQAEKQLKRLDEEYQDYLKRQAESKTTVAH